MLKSVEGRNMQKLEFQSKAKNLYMLQDKLEHAEVLPLLILTKKQIKDDMQKALDLIDSFCKDKHIQKLIVRSSSMNEDSKHTSNAGAFLSIANITAKHKEAVIKALQQVADSMPNDHDEILIQPYLQHIILCGVGFSVDKDNFSPYYCIECDISGSSSGITDGTSKDRISYFQYRDTPTPAQESMHLDINTKAIKQNMENPKLGTHVSLMQDLDCNNHALNPLTHPNMKQSIASDLNPDECGANAGHQALHSNHSCANQDEISNIDPNIKRFKQVIALIQELESILQYKFIDIEFAFAKPFLDDTQTCKSDSTNQNLGTKDNQEKLYLLQVRPLVKPSINLFNALPQDALSRLQKRLTSFLKKTPNVLGDRAIFGVMPDWNPAEIIGLRPKRLALSLYKEIVTDNIWAYQRDNYGYKALHSHPLMHSFLGIPYIDVRASFNSFIPKELDSKIATKLANYYLQKLDSNPHFHDKVEFEIVFSCYDFNTPDSLLVLLKHGFNSNEIKRIEFALLELTNQIINTKNGYYAKDLEKIAKLQDSFSKIKNSDYSLIDKIYWSLQECKRLGTLPFAGIARAGFVAVLMLNSLVSIGFLSEKEKNAFLHTLNTISKQLAESSMNLNIENKAAFLEKFGHLRAGSYDILSPRYDEDFGRYFSLDKKHEVQSHMQFCLSEERLNRLDRILKEHGLKIDSSEFFKFLKIAIEGREYAKFEFSKLLSYALVLISELGEHYDISKEDMAYLDIHDILSLYASLYSKSPKQKLLDSIARHKEEYKLTLAIKLPPLITAKEQIFAFQTQQVMPNFITQKSITALKALHTDSDLEGKIVLIYAADPGFDYLFTKNIAGFITCYGGANSHMAIRASEQNMPAVIGVGEEQYQKYCKAERIMIDCQSEQIICL